MRSYEDAVSELNSLIKNFSRADITKIEKRRLKIRHAKLKPILLILQTNPREEFLKDQLEEQVRKLKILEDRYSEWLKSNASKHDNPAAAYRSEVGIGDIKKRIKVLKSIL